MPLASALSISIPSSFRPSFTTIISGIVKCHENSLSSSFGSAYLCINQAKEREMNQESFAQRFNFDDCQGEACVIARKLSISECEIGA